MLAVYSILSEESRQGEFFHLYRDNIRIPVERAIMYIYPALSFMDNIFFEQTVQ